MNLFFKKMIIPSAILLWSLMYILETRGHSARDVLLIRPVVLLLGTTYLIILYKEYFFKKNDNSEDKTAYISSKEIKILLLMIFYILIIQYLGFVITSFISMLAMLYVLEVKKIQHLLMFSSVSTLILYVAFKVVLMVPLPSGLFGL